MATAVGRSWTLQDRGDGRGDMLPQTGTVPTWSPIPDQNFVAGTPVNRSVGQFLNDPDTLVTSTEIADPVKEAELNAEGITYNPTTLELQYDGTGTGARTVSAVVMRANYSGAPPAPGVEQDWQDRISGPEVVWYHDFRNEAEVDQFRWSPGIGNDPQDGSTGSADSNTIRWNNTDGITGGACLESFRPAGTSEGKNWWRPFSALDGAGNGKGTDDPAASGAVPVETWAPTQGGSQTSTWRGGTYGPPSTGSWDGREFYFQMRMKIDPRRVAEGTSGGKIHYVTRSEQSLVGQELVTYYLNSTDFSIYKQGGLIIESQTIPPVPFVTDQWDTYLYRVLPGDENVPNTQIEAWRALYGETSYTKIFSALNVAIDYQDIYDKCWNTLLVAIYHNGLNITTDFWQRYDQIIFSRAWIPPPQAYD